MLEGEAYCLEESMDAIHERLFEAENAAELLMGISKELISRFQIVQFNLNGSMQREKEFRSKLQESMLELSAEESALQKCRTSSAWLDNSLVQRADSLRVSLKEAEDKYNTANSEAMNLRDQVSSLEEKLRESDIQLQQTKAAIEAGQDQKSILQSELTEMENAIVDLQENIVMAESWAEIAEAKCTLLIQTSLELNEELSFIKTHGTKRENLLESKLKESSAQLEHTKTSVEAIEKQQGLLYAALSDMENLIEDLKAKFSKAESRAESAESKCALLTETNVKLNEELGQLRGRLECLERLLHQSDEENVATAKNIGNRTRSITDLVMRLASEREHLQMQISGLAKENKTLGEKCWQRNDSIYATSSYEIKDNRKEFSFVKSLGESITELSKNLQGENSATPSCRTDMVATVSVEDKMGAGLKLETVRSVEASQLKQKDVLLAILLLVLSICAMYIFSLESCTW